MMVFLPYRAEFGFVCMVHAPQVFAHIERGTDRMVCIEPGVEALYPGCRYFYVSRRLDEERRARPEPELIAAIKEQVIAEYGPEHEFVKPDAEAKRRYFIPQPRDPAILDKAACDVVVCPRKREYGPDKNWDYWPALTQMLTDAGLSVFAGGSVDASEPVPCRMAWEHEDCLDWTIAAMLSAKVVVATDAGLAHLAVLCGRPLVMITHGEGMVSPGHDDVGNPYWPVKIERFNRENHTGSTINLVHDAWFDPDVTFRAIQDTLAAEAAQQ